MKTKILKILILWFVTNISHAQIGIKATNTPPHPSAMLDVESTTKGMLVPRMTSSQRTLISNLTPGLLVYDTDVNSFFFYNGTVWQNLSVGGGGGSSQWNISGNNIYNANAGNVGIGTTNATAPLSFGNNIGNKINFYGDGNLSHYGVGLQGSLLQFYTQENTAAIAFGVGKSNAFTENMRIGGNGNLSLTGKIINEGLNFPILGNTWSIDPGGNFPINYYKDKLGIVHLAGIATTTSVLASPIFVLPQGYRPQYNEIFIVFLISFSAAGAGTIRIFPTGEVDLSNIPGYNAGATLSVSLSGITFRAN